ncbi:MAG: hypothetical protein ACO2XZ_00660 [Rickettsiales bacterium]
MIFFAKAIVFFALIFFSACEKYYVGFVRTSSLDIPELESFSYNIHNDRVIVKGSINSELFIGDLYSTKLVRKIEEFRNPNIKKSVIKERNNMSVLRLTGNKSSVIECFVKQNNSRNIKKGGKGRCYLVNTGQTFDITFERPYF